MLPPGRPERRRHPAAWRRATTPKGTCVTRPPQLNTENEIIMYKVVEWRRSWPDGFEAGRMFHREVVNAATPAFAPMLRNSIRFSFAAVGEERTESR